ncbi:MAG: hypothetical protein IPH20_24130 [Bacteroidales bacterium]|nr:hypothetical protein [Bacteroidales bacterium]
MLYGLFISYSSFDNVYNRITELKNQNESDYPEFAKEKLNYGGFKTSFHPIHFHPGINRMVFPSLTILSS